MNGSSFSNEQPSPAVLVRESRIYRAGTLQYGARGIVILFALLLMGDFCAMTFESIFRPFVPLYLKDLKASNTVIGILTSSTAGLMNLLFLPNVSMWSDRTRTRWGRRIPFLFWAAPAAVVSLILIAFGPDIAKWLHRAVFHPGMISLMTLTLGVLAAFIILWHLTNMILVNVYNFLLRDVVPLELMPRFLAFFRFMGSAGHFTFQWFFFKYMLLYPKTLFLSLGLIFFGSFLLICWGVKEGNYPEPPVSTEKKPHFLILYFTYFREGLGIPLYRNFFIAFALVVLGTNPVDSFLVLFARQSLKLDLETVGRIQAWSTLAYAFMFLPSGYLCEKFNPFRVACVALVAGVVVRVLGFFLVHGSATWLTFSVCQVIPTVAWGLGAMSVSMILFPKEKFGQFSSGLNAFGYGSLVLTSGFIGWFMDLVGSNYRMIFVVSLLCYAAAILPMLLVYRGWKQHGGSDNYVPPLPSSS